MSMLVLLAEASASVLVAAPIWTTSLSNPIVGGVIVAVVTQVLRAIPQVPLDKGPKVAAVASILSIVAGAVSAASSGSLDGFDVGSAWGLLVSALMTLTTAMGTAEATSQAAGLLKPRSPGGG